MKISFKIGLFTNNPGWEIILNHEGILEDSSDWCLSPIEEVKKNVYSTEYPKERFHFV